VICRATELSGQQFDALEFLPWPQPATAAQGCQYRHIASLEAFGVSTHGIWTDGGGAHRLVALVSFPAGADPTAVSDEYMASPGFKAHMDGFDPADIVGVATIPLDATPSSPIR
jgi:hypothetical protein